MSFTRMKNIKHHKRFAFADFMNFIFIAIGHPLLSSRLCVRLIFNVDLPKQDQRKLYFDLTTLILRKALLKHVKDAQRILEIGTGEYCLLPIFLSKRRNVDITAVDIKPANIVRSKIVAKNNKAEILLQESDVTSNVEGEFDVIFWNLPYVPTQCGKNFYNDNNEATNQTASLGWNGGENGLEVFKKFLHEAPQFLKRDGKIIAGINTYFASFSNIKEIIKACGLRLVETCSSLCNPSKAIVISK